MTVLKSRQTQSQFKVFEHAVVMRKAVTDILLCDFAYKVPQVSPTETEGQRRRRQCMTRWFIKKRRDAADDIMCRIIRYITVANKIFPTCTAELEQRRLYQDKAIGECFALEQELQYCMEILPVKAKRYFICADYIMQEIALIKAWRKSDNKFKAKIKG